MIKLALIIAIIVITINNVNIKNIRQTIRKNLFDLILEILMLLIIYFQKIISKLANYFKKPLLKNKKFN
jgi:hypothetical protein